MAEINVPSIDFSSIGNLGNVYTQARNDATRRQTLADLASGTGQIDPRQLYASGDLSLAQLGQGIQNHNDQLAQQQWTQQHTSARDAVDDRFRQAQLEISKRAADRADAAGPEQSATQRAAAASKFGLDPGTPEFKQFVLTGSLPDNVTNKPVPVETIGGTKFLVRDPNSSSGYRMIDPAQLGQPAQPQQQGQPNAQPQPVPQQPQATPLASAPGAEPPTQPQVAVQQNAPVQPGTAPQAAAPDIEAVDPKTGRREGYLQSLDPQVRDYIKKVADYEIDPRTTSVKGGMREKLMSAVAKYDPTYNQNDFGARAKSIKDFSTGPQGNIIRSFDVAIDHLDTLQKAATAMNNGDTRALNAVRNAWREQTGSDLPTNFQALVPLVSGEIAKAVIGSNNALSDREELRGNLQKASSPAQITGVISGYKALMGGQLKGLKKQYEATTGKKDFDSKIRDVTKQELEGASSGGNKTVIDGYTITEH